MVNMYKFKILKQNLPLTPSRSNATKERRTPRNNGSESN